MLALPLTAARADAPATGCAPSLAGPLCAGPTREERAALREQKCHDDPRVQLGQVTFEACLGAELFFRETFGGNGRTCGSCHPAQNNYTVDPQYISTLAEDDPLFIAEQNDALSDLERPELLRDYALFVVNPDGFEAPTEKFVMRSASHLLGLATSITAPPIDPEDPTHHATDGTLLPPLDRLGWSGDGAPGQGQLRDFADGAIRQHMTRSLARRQGVDFQLPSDAERDALAEFSRSIGRMNELDLTAVHLSDAAAERGRVSYVSGHAMECASRCHVNAGANSFNLDANDDVTGLSNASFDIGTQLVPAPGLAGLHLPIDGGFGTRPLDEDGDGVDDSFGNGGMNPPPLIEAADTAPMFHSNAFATLEDAIGFYASQDFARSFVALTTDFENRDFGEPIPLTPADIVEVGKFLRVLNASLNCQMTLRRLHAALEIVRGFRDAQLGVEQGLVTLARAELSDALEVLSAVHALDVREQHWLRDADALLRPACGGPRRAAVRESQLRRAIALVERAARGLGSGMDMDIGQGTLLF
jgi:cytochrome c peroxidase